MTASTMLRSGATGKTRHRSRKKLRGGRLLVRQTACIAAVLVLWSLVRWAGLVSPDLLPSVFSVVKSFVQLLGTSDFWSAIGDTLLGAIKGLVVAFVIGVPIGLLTGTYKIAERFTRLFVDFGRSFPIVALLPVFLLVLGATSGMESTVVFLACVFPLFLQAQYGAAGVEPMVSETARCFRIHGLLRFYKVILPSALPSIMTGLRLAAATSVLVAVGVEILSAVPGLGGQLANAQLGGDSATVFAYIFTAGMIGFAINRVCEAAERHFLRWHPSTSAN
jgi:ABC-type nitrate/sulfonate/bicarbonate transport system permease component